jgi:hypothetical protein
MLKKGMIPMDAFYMSKMNPQMSQDLISNMKRLTGTKFTLDSIKLDDIKVARPYPKPGQVYMHFKKKLYVIYDIAKHSEDHNKLFVVYGQLYPPYETYIRPLDMFMSPVDKEKYPNVTFANRSNLIKKVELCDYEGKTLLTIEN